MELSDRIKARRTELGLTLEDIGNTLGVSKTTIQRYESGKIKNLKQATIKRLAVVLRTTPEYLMGWDEQKTSKPTEDIDPQISVIARASRKMTPEQITKLREMAQVLFPEAFIEEDK